MNGHCTTVPMRQVQAFSSGENFHTRIQLHRFTAYLMKCSGGDSELAD